MDKYDVIVVGGGLIGCFAARQLAEYDLRVAVIEKNFDVCTEISRANTAIVYGGYDHKPHTLKADMCNRGNRDFSRLCKELNVPFKRCGSLMAAFGPRGERVINQKYQQGLENGVEGLKLLSPKEALDLEPNLNPGLKTALFCPATGTVNPWELGLAAAKNAEANGVSFLLGTELTDIKIHQGLYVVIAENWSAQARAVINCAGINADKIRDRISPYEYRLVPTKGDYIVLDTKAGDFVRHIIFHESEDRGKGATIVPTIDGNILLGPSNEPLDDGQEFATTREGLDLVRRASREVLPDIPLNLMIRTFSAVRPNPFYLEKNEQGKLIISERSIHSFIIEQSQPGFISTAGIKTPGLTCANEIAAYVKSLVLDYLGPVQAKQNYNPVMNSHPRFSRLTSEQRLALGPGQDIVCRCRKVTKPEILNAIQEPLGAVSLDGLKRRTGICTGRCQGGYCEQRAVELLASELGVPVGQVVKGSPLSWIFREEA